MYLLELVGIGVTRGMKSIDVVSVAIVRILLLQVWGPITILMPDAAQRFTLVLTPSVVHLKDGILTQASFIVVAQQLRIIRPVGIVEGSIVIGSLVGGNRSFGAGRMG